MSDDPKMILVIEEERAQAQLATLREALDHYAHEYCEGWCKDAPSGALFDDCGGCEARAALAQTLK
jgi:hypothetical protein